VSPAPASGVGRSRKVTPDGRREGNPARHRPAVILTAGVRSREDTETLIAKRNRPTRNRSERSPTMGEDRTAPRRLHAA